MKKRKIWEKVIEWRAKYLVIKTIVRICKKIESEMTREYNKREILDRKKLLEINKLNW